jgi:hypothetical protein
MRAGANANFAVAAATTATRLRPIVPEDYGVAGSNLSCIVASSAVQPPYKVGYGAPRAAYDRWLTRIYLCFVLIRGNHEAFNRLALNESIHNVRDVRDRDASVKKVIGFD